MVSFAEACFHAVRAGALTFPCPGMRLGCARFFQSAPVLTPPAHTTFPPFPHSSYTCTPPYALLHANHVTQHLRVHKDALDEIIHTVPENFPRPKFEGHSRRRDGPATAREMPLKAPAGCGSAWPCEPGASSRYESVHVGATPERCVAQASLQATEHFG